MKFSKLKNLLAAALIVYLLFGVTSCGSAAGGKVIILMYHDFRVDRLDDDDDDLYVTTDVKFLQDMRALSDLGYSSLNLEKYYEGGYKKNKNYFILTVDDGYISNYTVLFPILAENKIYADIFMCTEDDVRPNHFKYADAKKMEESGYVKIYSHLTKHMDATELELDEFLSVAEKSYDYLNTRISGGRLKMTAYPHGLYNRETVEALYERGTVFQLVQNKIDANAADGAADGGGDTEWNASDFGVLYRVNVEHRADMPRLIEYYISQYCAE